MNGKRLLLTILKELSDESRWFPDRTESALCVLKDYIGDPEVDEEVRKILQLETR